MKNKIFKSHDFTDQAVNDFFVRIDNYCANPDNDIAEVLMEFRLYTERCLPKNFTGVIEYHGFKIRVQRPKSYTWEKNNQIQGHEIDFYKQLHSYYEQLQDSIKETRADLKRTAEKLEKAHPESESIKYGFTVALMA